jgi:hypothetical protein
VARNLVDHPAPGDRYEWQGHIVDVGGAPIVTEKGFRIPILLYIDGQKEIWMRSPWLHMHKTARLLRTAEEFIKQIEASKRGSLSVVE